MTDQGISRAPTDDELTKSVWAKAQELVGRLEGTSVRRLAIEVAGSKIEIERGLAVAASPEAEAQPALPGGAIATGAGPGPGVAPEARAASGAFAAIDAQDGNLRIPVLAPLVGIFYRASQPGAAPFAQEGELVEAGQTLCIVEAMKLMNEIAANESGRVAEIVAENGEWVEFEQVLMYLEPAGEQ
jgi:acetyl-CoA carboxylase biotin carboxyl carrier protein